MKEFSLMKIDPNDRVIDIKLSRVHSAALYYEGI